MWILLAEKAGSAKSLWKNCLPNGKFFIITREQEEKRRKINSKKQFIIKLYSCGSENYAAMQVYAAFNVFQPLKISPRDFSEF